MGGEQQTAFRCASRLSAQPHMLYFSVDPEEDRVVASQMGRLALVFAAASILLDFR